MSKILWLDLETTDADTNKPIRGAVHQLAYILDIDGKVVKEGVYNMRPFPKDLINYTALNVTGVTYEQIMAYPSPVTAFNELLSMMKINGPMVLGGFNNSIFDSSFFYSWWWKCIADSRIDKNTADLSKLIFFDPLDVRTLALDALLDERPSMKTFRLEDVAKAFGVEFNPDEAHDASYDIKKTREIYYKIKEKQRGFQQF